MNDWDRAYMQLNKTDPEPENKTDDTYAYIAGCIFAVVFWFWFFMWIISK